MPPAKKKTPAKKPAAVVRLPVPPPQLRGCPKCGLPVEAGTNPDRLAHHDCAFVVEGRVSIPPTVDNLRSAILVRLRDQIPSANVKDLGPMLDLLAAFEGPPAPKAGRKPEAEASPSSLREFIAAGVPRP